MSTSKLKIRPLVFYQNLRCPPVFYKSVFVCVYVCVIEKCIYNNNSSYPPATHMFQMQHPSFN